MEIDLGEGLGLGGSTVTTDEDTYNDSQSGRINVSSQVGLTFRVE